MKKIMSRLIAVVMLIALFPVNIVMAETEKKEKVEVLNAVYPTYELQKDDVFQFGMSIKNNSGYTLRDVEVSVINSSFNTINESAKREVKELLNDKVSYISPFNLIYNGGTESRLFVKIRYRIGSEEHVNEKVVYYNMKVKPGDNSDGVPSKPELYKPFVVMMNTEQPSLESDSIESIDITFKNDSQFEAKNIKITGLFSEGNFELAEISSIKYIGALKSKEENKVSYKIKGKKKVESGVYPITFKVQYENVYGEKWDENIAAYIKYKANIVDTNVDIVMSGDYSSVIAGEDFGLGFVIKNNSETQISNVSVELFDLNSNNMINKNSNFKMVGNIDNSKESEVKFDMSTNESAETGNYKIKAKVKYQDMNGNEKEFEKSFYKKIEKHNSEIFIGGISSNIQIVKPNSEFEITVPVYNYGKKNSENLRISVNGEAGLINTTSNVVLMSSINPDDMKELKFKFKTTPKIAEGNKTITIKVLEGTKEQSTTYIVYADAEKKEEENTSVPKIIISKYEPEPMMVKAGKNFDLNLVLLNTHREKTVRNIKITLTTNEGSDKTGSVFSPVNSSNTYYIDEITPKQEAEMNITMFTIPDAKSKTYTINVTMEYEDEDGKTFTATDLIGIPVRQQSKFMTSDINVPENSEMGRAIRLDIDINNNGKIELANFTVKVEGDFSTQSSTKYIGSIQPGAREYYDVDLMPTKEGLNKGAFIFSYEEPSGEIVEVRKEFASTAAKPYVPEYNGNNGEVGPPVPPVKKGFPWVKVLLGVGAVAVLVIVVVVTKREKKKKEMELDE